MRLRKRGIVALAIYVSTMAPLAGTAEITPRTLASPKLQVRVDGNGGDQHETLLLKSGSTWAPALVAASSVFMRTSSGFHACVLTRASPIAQGLLLEGDCGEGRYEQRLTLTREEDVLDVSTRVTLHPGALVNSIEDRYDFAPPRHPTDDDHEGPLDFVWSQNLKSASDDLIPSNSFKSPVVMMQQGNIFAALMPHVSDRRIEVRALDLDVTSGPRPWMSFGVIPSEPHGHSYFRRDSQATLRPVARTIEYEYSIVLSEQPAKLGYRRVVRRLWQQLGHPALLLAQDEQQNTLRPELHSFAAWQSEVWQTEADRIYQAFACGGRLCGTLKSNRSVSGDWKLKTADAWFNPWFQTLRTAYGWFLHGRATNDVAMMNKAESVLNLALSSPRNGGAFSTIYLVDSGEWKPGDAWAGYGDSYHAFAMSWTAYWMLRWAEDLTPSRKEEILRFVRPYGDFLLAHQQASGVIPSWYLATSLKPRSELRDFNAETAPSALLLATLGSATGDARYLAGAQRAMEFVSREVVPRQRWFDFETFLSCSRKPYDFYDRWTAQFPQNNLAEIEAPQALLALYDATGKKEYLERGARMLDYLLLTQQVWNNPQFTPKLFGGFTTQNSDNEWSDARQAYAATLLADYYRATGNMEYLERAVAAARSTFAVAPWENWAHTGYLDEPGAFTGFHWGSGSAMTSIEILQPILGDALIDLDAKSGVGFDEATVTHTSVQGDFISFFISCATPGRTLRVRFRGVQSAVLYHITWNGGAVKQVSGKTLIEDGLMIGPLA